MGISIEQYRSSIGSHDNFVKTKDILSRLNDHCWSLMFVMFYLNVFYLPVLKQVVGQHKMWNDVMFWFSQMIFYNAYIPLLIRQANDVEENPGPTIFDVIDPTRTICADYSQGNEALFCENAVSDVPKIEHWPFRNKRNQTQHMKRKRVNESEGSREKRLAQQRLTREKKCANESSESKKKGLANPISVSETKNCK
ncbi:unnamed protein product [Pocillopora meandrina]|uniref:Uncharacterized protein n=1 Tax=Pocillopora meandrina TaxID=46732 RepID=A0AAU9Y2Y9_9CNID|nr:unnamed protein product [Pocillopora meandrina]